MGQILPGRIRARGRFTRGLGFAAVLLFSACSIHAPDVQLVAGDGSQVTGDAATGSEAGAGTVAGEGAAGTAATGEAGAGEVSAADAQRCKGQATQTGVTGNSIKLGATFALSGPVSNISGPILKGVQAYFNKVNEEGGVHGRKIALKWYDDGWDAQRGKGYIKRLVENDKVFALTVVPSSNGLDASKTYLEQRRMPVFGTSGLIESQFESPMQWPVGVSTKSSARIALVDMKRRGARNLAVIWLDLLAGRQAMEAFKNSSRSIMGKAPEDFLVNVNGYRVSISEPDFGPVWARVIDDTKRWQRAHGQTATGRPDYVALAIDPTNAIKALQAAENIGFRPKLAWGGAAPLFLDIVPQGTNYAARTGLLASSSYYPPIGKYLQKPAVKEYVATVRKYFGDDVDLKNPYLEGGYAGAALTVEVLKRVGPCLTRERAIKVADSLRNYSAAGLTPPLTFTPPGQGAGHYGNVRALTVRVNDNSDWVVERDFIADPTPGKP